jgi:hypothetical protein
MTRIWPAGLSFFIRTTILQDVVFHARFSCLLNISCGNLGSYVSRQDAKGAKVNNTAIVSSWRSWRLCERTGFGCGRRPRWVLRALRGSDLLVPAEGRAGETGGLPRSARNDTICGEEAVGAAWAKGDPKRGIMRLGTQAHPTAIFCPPPAGPGSPRPPNSLKIVICKRLTILTIFAFLSQK